LTRVGRWLMAGLISLAQAPASSRQATPAPVAFINVSVVPMDTERVLPAQTVVVRGDRIVALGPARSVEVPADAVRVAARAAS